MAKKGASPKADKKGRNKPRDVRYVIFANLTGLHDKIYACYKPTRKDDLFGDEWWDKTGNFSVNIKKGRLQQDDGCTTWCFEDKTMAQFVLQSLKAYRDHIVGRL